MRLFLVLSIALFNTSGIKCQDKIIESLYVNTGLGTTMKNGLNVHIGGNFTTVKLYTISFNYYQILFKDDHILYSKGLSNDPLHHIDDFEISGTKFFQFHKRFRGGFGIGISYLRYYKPINIRYNNQGFFSGYEYDEVKHLGYGVKVKGVMEFQAFHIFGIGLEVFYQYNPYYPYFGANMNLLLGKLRPRINRDSN